MIALTPSSIPIDILAGEKVREEKEIRMEHQYTGGGSWTIPNMQTQSNTGTPSNQDHLYLPQQQFQQSQFQLPQQHQQFQSPQNQQFQSPRNQQFQSPQNQQLQSPLNQQLQSPQTQQFQSPQNQQLQSPQNQQFHSPQNQQLQSPQNQQYHSPQQQQQHQSLASHFHLIRLVEKLAEAVENGTRDQQTDALISDLSNLFEKCQQLLNSISASIGSRTVTVEGQKRKLEETEQLQNQRRNLISNYRNSVEEMIKLEP